jgi:hypothetical protein
MECRKDTGPNTNAADFEHEKVDLILKELRTVYLKMKKRKDTGTDGINAEIFKYGKECRMERKLFFLNKC